MPSDRVTLRDIYEIVKDVEEKIDKRLEKVEGEVEEVKAFQNKAVGILAVAGTFISLASNYIWSKIINNS